MSLGTLLRRLRPPSADEVEALNQYLASMREPLARVCAMRDEWMGLREYEHEEERLANSASVNRWALVRLVEQVEGIEPPKLAVAAHREIVEELGEAARACQLLANGHRFHKWEVVCDGQVLLGESVEAIERQQHALREIAGG
jgi:hypothetical protein